MQLRTTDLAAHLQRELQGLYVIHGNEPLLVAESGDAIRRAAREQGFSDREVLVAGPGFKWDSLTLAAGNLSLFGDRKLIDLRIPSGKPGKEGGDALQKLAAQHLDGITLLITLPELDWATRKSAWFTALDKHAQVIEANAPDLQQLPAWIGERLARQQQQADADTLLFMAEHVEGNLLAAHQEIQKLALLCPPGTLDPVEVRGAVLNVARYSLDDLRQALLEGQLPRLQRLLQGLAGEGEAPPLVLWALTSEIRALTMIRSGLDRQEPLPVLLKNERIFDEQRRRLASQAVKRLDTPTLYAALQHAARIDRMIKGLDTGDFWSECLRLCTRVCPPPRQPATPATTAGPRTPPAGSAPPWRTH